MSKQTPAAPAAEDTKPTKTLTFGAKVGRGITRLTELNDAKQAELRNHPENIKARFAKRRAGVLDGLEPNVRAAVLAASGAFQDPSA